LRRNPLRCNDLRRNDLPANRPNQAEFVEKTASAT
jgi:hypothetical protein